MLGRERLGRSRSDGTGEDAWATACGSMTEDVLRKERNAQRERDDHCQKTITTETQRIRRLMYRSIRNRTDRTSSQPDALSPARNPAHKVYTLYHLIDASHVAPAEIVEFLQHEAAR